MPVSWKFHGSTREREKKGLKREKMYISIDFGPAAKFTFSLKTSVSYMYKTTRFPANCASSRGPSEMAKVRSGAVSSVRR